MARFAVFGSACLQVIGRALDRTESRIAPGTIHFRFGGTGLAIAVDLAAAGHDVHFVTAVPDTDIDAMIIDALREANMTVHAEFDPALPESGACVQFLPGGELLAAVDACPLGQVVFRERSLAAAIDHCDEIVLEGTLHERVLDAAIRRATDHGKRGWLVAASEQGAANVVALLERERQIAGTFVKDTELAIIRQGLKTVPGLIGVDAEPPFIAELLGGVLIHTRNQAAQCQVWRPRRDQPERHGTGAFPGAARGQWPDITDRFVARALHVAVTRHLGLDTAVSLAAQAVPALLAEERATYTVNHLARQLSALRHDALTGLGNRHNLQTVLRRYDPDTEAAVIMVDLDHFKRINDTFGHDTGDRVLAAVGQIVRTMIRGGDRAFRVGGEELLVLMPLATQTEALAVAERLRAAITSHVFAHGPVTASLGVAHGQIAAFDRIRGDADQALYAAKQAGRNRVMHGRAVP